MGGCEGGQKVVTDCDHLPKVAMTAKKNNGATLGFEETLWQAADKMRGTANRICGSLSPRRLKDEIRKDLKELGFYVWRTKATASGRAARRRCTTGYCAVRTSATACGRDSETGCFTICAARPQRRTEGAT